MKKTFCFVLCIAAFFFFAACDAVPQSLEPAKITAVSLWAEFETNRVAAEEKYIGAKILLTGEISEMTDAFMGKPCILLENGVDSIPAGIFCFFHDSFDVSVYSPGETITVSGTCFVMLNIAGDDTPYIYIDAAEIVDQIFKED